MKNDKRLLTFIRLAVLGVFIELSFIITLVTSSSYTSSSPDQLNPTIFVPPTLPAVIVVTPTPTLEPNNNRVAPLAQANTSRMADAIPNQFMLRFPANVSEAERANYIASLGGEIIQEIGRINQFEVVSVRLPVGVDDSAIQGLSTLEPDFYVESALDVDLNDEYFLEQWGLKSVNALNARAVLTEDEPIILVAVIDSGVNSDHPDLIGQVVGGWDYVENDDIPQDEFGHGTGVAGLLAALANNQQGIVGLAPHVRIMPLRVLNAQGIGTYSDVAAAIMFAVDEGAKIINLSLGGYNSSSVLQDAIDYAIQRGVYVIASAGNTGNETMLYPAAYEPVVAVGAVNERYEISSFSSRGPRIDLYAPGENILTTTADGKYAAQNGTSFAAPYVSGVAALEMAFDRPLIQNGEIVSFGGTGMPNPPIVTGTPRPSTTVIDPAVISAIQNNGEARVFINLFDPVSGQGLLDTDVQQIAALQNEILSALSADDFRLVHQYTSLPALAGNLTANGLAVLQSQTFAASVYLDQRTFAHTAEAKELMGVNTVYQTPNMGFRGAGVRVAVLDTGVDLAQFTDSLVAQRCFTDGDCDFLLLGDTPYEGSSALDHDGHGTHVAGIILGDAGIAPEAELIAVRVLGNDGSGWTSDWIKGLDWILTNQDTLNVDIINMSLGSSDLIVGTCDNSFGTVFPAGIQAINQLTTSGVTIFASSGNQGAINAVEAPACLSNVIAVGATYDSNLGRQPETGTYDDGFLGGWPNCVDETTAPGKVTCFSNTSTKLELLAPGAVIVSNGLGGGTREYWGTSQASPMAAGVAALMLDADNTLIPSQILSLLKENGTSTQDWRTGQSFPIIDAFKTIESIIADFCVNVTEIPRGECHALVDLYNSTGGTNWTIKTGWLDTFTPCSWTGVVCNAGHVTELVMLDNNLEGPLPASIGSLPELVRLYLAFNNLSGVLPTNISNLKKLNVLHLGTNQLSGSLPRELFSLTSLVQINLAGNQLSGRLSEDLGQLSNLQILNLSLNKFTGPIPISIGALNKLFSLSLDNNLFAGEIPTTLTNATSLLYLSLANNQLTGPIPAQINNLSSLGVLTLSNNQLSGSIPSSLGDLDQLNSLQLRNNRFSGSIPAELGQLINLEYFRLSNNRLSGEIPASLCNLSPEKLYIFELDGNQLSGTIPTCFADFHHNVELLVTSDHTDEIQRFNGETGAYLGTFVEAGTTSLDGGQELIRGWDGNLIISSNGSSEILRYSYSDGSFLGVVVPAGSGGLKNPSGMARQNNGLYVASTDTNEILLYSAITGAFIEPFTSCPFDFNTNSPTRIHFGPDGNLYVIHQGGIVNNIVVYDGTTGVCIKEFDNFSLIGELFIAVEMAFGPDGYLYIASNASDEDIIRFDVKSGQSVSRFVPDFPSDVTNLTFGPDGNLYVAYEFDGVSGVDRYNGTTGAFIDEFIPGSPAGPERPTDLLFRNLGLDFDISYNSLVATDPPLRAFLNEYDVDWESTQTSPPINVLANPTSANGVQISWLPVGDAVTPGYYEVFYRSHAEIDFKPAGQTTNKVINSFNLSGLNPSTTYEFQVRTISLPSATQQNRLESAFSAPAQAVTLASGCAGVTAIPVSECEALETVYNSLGGSAWVNNGNWLQEGTTFYVASGLGDGSIVLWDSNTGQPVGEKWIGHLGGANSVAFSPDGSKLVSGGEDATVRLWDVATHQIIGEPWTGHVESVYSVAFSPDGSQVVSGGADATVRLWDVTTGQMIGEPWTGHPNSVNSVAFSPDGSQVVSTGGADATVRLWDVTTGQMIGEPWTGHTVGVSSAAFSPDGSQVVSGGWDAILRLWDVTTGQTIGEPWTGHSSLVNSVAFSPDGSQVVSASGITIIDPRLILWDVTTGQMIGEPWIGHSQAVNEVAFSPDGLRVVSGSSDRSLFLWDPTTGQPIDDPWNAGGFVFGVAFSPVPTALPMNPCTWFGVTCANGHITELKLPNNNLAGNLPAALANLTELEELDLSSNALIGSIPASFGGLTSLRQLKLNKNGLSGSIPTELGSMDAVEMIWLSNNQFSGQLPAGLDAAGDTLIFLGLDSNLLTGPIPDMWVSFTRLQHLALAGNQFRGDIPASFATLNDTLSNAFMGYNALNIPATLPPYTDPVLSLLEEINSDWKLTQTTPPTNVEITQVSPANGLPTTQSTYIGIRWDPPVFTEFLLRYEIDYTIQHPNGSQTNGIIPDVPPNKTSWTLDALSTGSVVSATVRSVMDAYNFEAPGSPIFPCTLITNRAPLTDFPLPSNGTGTIESPEDGDCTIPTNPNRVLVSGTISEEFANHSIFIVVYTPTESFPKYYPQGRVDPICKNPRGVDIDASTNTWTTDVFFGREGFTEEFHVILVAVEKGGVTEEIFKSWLVAGCEAYQIDPKAPCAYPGFPLVDLPTEPCPYQLFPDGVTEIDSIRVHSAIPVIGKQQVALVSSESNLAVGDPVPETVIDILNFKAEDALQPGEDPGLPNGELPSCTTNVSGKYRVVFPGGKFRPIFPNSSNPGEVDTDIKFIVTTSTFAPVMAVYSRNAAGEITGELGCVASESIKENNNITLQFPILEGDYVIYVWGNNGTGGDFTFQALPQENWKVDQIPYETEAAVIILEEDKDDPLPPDACHPQVIKQGKFRATFPGGKFRPSFPGGQSSHFVISVITNDIEPAIIVYEKAPVGNVFVACSEPGQHQLSVELQPDLDYEIVVLSRDNSEGSFILTIDPVTVTIDRLPFAYNGFVNDKQDLLNQDCPQVDDTRNVFGQFKAVFRSTDFPSAFPNGVGRFRFLVNTTTIEPVIAVYRMSPQGGIASTPETCVTTEAIGSKDVTFTLQQGVDYLFTIRGDYGTVGDFDFWFEPLDTATVAQSPYIVKTNLNTSPYNLTPTCAPNSTGWFQVNLPKGSSVYQLPVEALQFGVETFSFIPVVAVYAHDGGALTEVACQTADAAGLLKITYEFNSSLDYTFVVRSTGGVGTDFEFGLATIPKLNTRTSYADCPLQGSTDLLSVTRLGYLNLSGDVVVEYATSPTERQIVQQHVVNHGGPIDYNLNVIYPPVSQWPMFTLPEIAYPVSVLIVRMNLNVELSDGRLVDQLGPGQGWAVVCVHAPDPISQNEALKAIWPNLLMTLSGAGTTQPTVTPTLVATLTLTETATLIPEVTETFTPPVDETAEVTASVEPTFTETPTPEPTVEPTLEPTIEPPTREPTLEPTVELPTTEPTATPTETPAAEATSPPEPTP